MFVTVLIRAANKWLQNILSIILNVIETIFISIVLFIIDIAIAYCIVIKKYYDSKLTYCCS